MQSTNDTDSVQADSLASFPDYYFETYEYADSTVTLYGYILLGAVVSFLYVAINKYSIYHFLREELDGKQEVSQPKYIGLKYIRYSKFKSLVFQICFFYGVFAGVLFFAVFSLNLNHIIPLEIPQSLAVLSKFGVIDFIWAGLLFGSICYPLLTSKLISSLGIDWLEKLIANPSDTNIRNDIDNSRRDFILHKIRKIEKILRKKNIAAYTTDHFKYHILKWNTLNEVISHEELLEALKTAEKKFNGEVVNFIVSVMKTLGDKHVETALNYRIWQSTENDVND